MKTKILSIIEVSVIFILMVGLFRVINSSALGTKITNFFDGRLFPGYTALLIASLFLYLLRTHGQPASLVGKKIKYQLAIFADGFFPIFALSVLLTWINWKQWPGAILISLLEIGLLYWFARATQKRPDWQQTAALKGIIFLPFALQNSAKLESVLVSIVYFYLFVALSEEILFRGYIQTRLNAAFGRPMNSFGIRWGWGWVISSLLFGLWHMGGSLDALEWPHVFWTIFAGLIFGWVREKSESVIAPAALHGLLNYGPQAILFYLLGR